ncbi:hypothetical protein D3C80_1894080 [compost metagenome]
MRRISTNDFRKHTVQTSSIVQFHNFLYFMQLVNSIVILRTFFKKNSEEGTNVKADTLRIYNKI